MNFKNMTMARVQNITQIIKNNNPKKNMMIAPKVQVAKFKKLLKSNSLPE